MDTQLSAGAVRDRFPILGDYLDWAQDRLALRAVPGGLLVGDLLIVDGSPGDPVQLPAGRWAGFGHHTRVTGPGSAEVPYPRRHLGHGWRFAAWPPAVAFQREGTVVWATGPEPDALEIHLATGRAVHRTLPDGTSVSVVDRRMRVTGPERDVVVVADGFPVRRVRGADVTVDLSQAVAAAAAVAQGRPPADHEGLRAALENDETTGVRHRYEIEPNPPRPGEPCVVRVRGAIDGGAVVAEDGPPVRLRGAGADLWEAELPGRPEGTVVRYRVELDGGGRVTDAAPDFAHVTPDTPFLRPARAGFSYEVREPTVPGWAIDAVIYHVIVDRFAGPVRPLEQVGFLGFAGGTIAGLTQRLDHLAGLGADVVWVSPLTPGHMHVPYDAVELFGVDPRLGSVDDVRTLCHEAHARGMRLILDAEFSYLGIDHPALTEHPEWFLWNDDGRPVGWFGNPTFAALDHADPGLRSHLLEATRWWLELGFDGYRLDSAHAASLDFWTDFGRAVRETRADAFTVAEDARTLEHCLRYRGRLDSYLDFHTCYGLRGFAGDGTVSASGLDATLRTRDRLPAGICGTTFFENHDMDRFSYLAGYDPRRVRLAHALLLTLPGPPVLYHGTEVGVSQPGPGDIAIAARAPMLWGDDQDGALLDDVSRMIELRRSRVALRRGAYRTLTADDAAGVLGFARETDTERVEVFANASGEVRRVAHAGADLELAPLSVTVLTDGADPVSWG